MQPTSLGTNLTGAQMCPASIQAMNEASEELTETDGMDTSAMQAQKLAYISEADAVGSVPQPPVEEGGESVIASLGDAQLAVLLDKLGERIAFERTGTRLYEALILKYQGTQQSGAAALPPARVGLDGEEALPDESPEETLQRIHDEEHAHFQLACEAMQQLGGDPTAVTPCADVMAVASSGLMQVLNDPRTTLAQCLGAILTAELTDNAGWELLIALAEEAGESELAGYFLGALADEQEHLEIIKNWLNAIVVDEPAPSLV